MKAFLITVAAIILGFAVSMPNVHWLTAVAMVVALCGAYAQYRDTLPFERVFTVADWQKDATDYRLTISPREHKKKSPAATFYLGTSPNFEVAMCDIHTDADGAVVLVVLQPFTGKVVIR